MRSYAPLAATVALASSILASSVWGEHGHRIVGRLAANALPSEMPAFFRESASRLSFLNFEPDRWRDDAEQLKDPALNSAEAYDHYIDLEWVPAGALQARHRFAFLDSVRVHGRRTPQVGLLPFAILELTQRLRSNFRRWRATTDPQERAWLEQRIVDDAGILGHYVADAANPHHTTEHHDGWVGENPRGYTRGPFFHSRFETQFVGAQLNAADVQPLLTASPRVFPDLRESILAYIRESHALVERLYELEKAEPFGRQNTNPQHKRFAAERLAAGTLMLRDLWWTAWVTSQ
jgi:hypothetical protein